MALTPLVPQGLAFSQAWRRGWHGLCLLPRQGSRAPGALAPSPACQPTCARRETAVQSEWHGGAEGSARHDDSRDEHRAGSPGAWVTAAAPPTATAAPGPGIRDAAAARL